MHSGLLLCVGGENGVLFISRLMIVIYKRRSDFGPALFEILRNAFCIISCSFAPSNRCTFSSKSDRRNGFSEQCSKMSPMSVIMSSLVGETGYFRRQLMIFVSGTPRNVVPRHPFPFDVGTLPSSDTFPVKRKSRLLPHRIFQLR